MQINELNLTSALWPRVGGEGVKPLQLFRLSYAVHLAWKAATITVLLC